MTETTDNVTRAKTSRTFFTCPGCEQDVQGQVFVEIAEPTSVKASQKTTKADITVKGVIITHDCQSKNQIAGERRNDTDEADGGVQAPGPAEKS